MSAPLPIDDQLLNVISTRERYEQFKRFMGLARVAMRLHGGAPFYAGLPQHANPLDAYDPDRTVLTYDLSFWKDYARFVHACLTGQYSLGQTQMPRYGSSQALDTHATEVFFAPFPCHADPQAVHDLAVDHRVTSTGLTRWDRNSSKHFARDEKPVAVTADRLYWNANEQRREQFRSLIPLYTDYRKEGDGTVLNSTGVQLNRNSMLIVRYVLSFLESANQYREKLTDVARVVQTEQTLRDTRKKLVEQIAKIQARKQSDIADHLQSDQYSPAQKSLIRRFNEIYRQTVLQIQAMTKPPVDNGGSGGRRARPRRLF
jgi:hypothetical protein